MSEIFCESTSILSDIKIVKMMSDYGFIGFGYYIAVIAELYKTGGRYVFEDLGIMAKNTGIERKKLRNFIDNCIKKYTHNDIGIFKSDDTSFYCEKVIDTLKKRKIKKSNGEKGGRPSRPTIQDRMIVNDIDFVNLEKSDYDKLVEKFNKEVIDTGIQILDNWLAKGSKTSKEHIGKNHYGFFRKDSWVINEAKKKLEKETASKWGSV